MMVNDKFDSRSVSKISYVCTLARTLEDGSTSFVKMTDVAISMADYFQLLRIANTLWAYDKMDHTSLDLFDALVAVALPCLGDFLAQQFANLAWAISKFPFKSYDVVFDQLAEEVKIKIVLMCCTSFVIVLIWQIEQFKIVLIWNHLGASYYL